MQDGRIVALWWATDHAGGRNLPNHVTFSHDAGEIWSGAVDTGVGAQASNLMYLGGDLLLAIHCHREGEVGLVVRVVDFAGDRWRSWSWTAFGLPVFRSLSIAPEWRRMWTVPTRSLVRLGRDR